MDHSYCECRDERRNMSKVCGHHTSTARARGVTYEMYLCVLRCMLYGCAHACVRMHEQNTYIQISLPQRQTRGRIEPARARAVHIGVARDAFVIR